MIGYSIVWLRVWRKRGYCELSRVIEYGGGGELYDLPCRTSKSVKHDVQDRYVCMCLCMGEEDAVVAGTRCKGKER